MKHLKFLLLNSFALVIVFTSISVIFSAPSERLEEGFLPTQGSYFDYHLSYERILPNGDFFGIVGAAEINYLAKTNSTHINIELEAIVDLSWIQGKQDINLSQNVISRSININEYQGEIIKGVLYYFGNEVRFFNPIHIPPDLINNKSNVYIWSYSAVNYNSRTINWNYKLIQVADYYFSDSGYADLGVNASYHLTTGILIVARCYFLEYTFQGLIQHILYVNLERTNIPVNGITDFSPALFFLGFASLLMILPIIIVITWILKRPKIIKEGGS